AGPGPVLADALRRPDLAAVRACRGPGFEPAGAVPRTPGGMSRPARGTARRDRGGRLSLPAVAVCATRRARGTPAERGAVGYRAGHFRTARPAGLGRPRARDSGCGEAPTGLGFRAVRARWRLFRLACGRGPRAAESAAAGRRAVPGHGAGVPVGGSQSRVAGTWHPGADPVARRIAARTGESARRGGSPVDVRTGAAAFHRGRRFSFAGFGR